MLSFISPAMLVFLFLIPLFVLFYRRQQQRRRRLAAQYGSFGSLQGGPGRGPGIRRHIPPAFFLTSLTVLALALARPQTVVSLPSIEGTVILAFDVSGSMAADDLKPNRMEAAKTAAMEFVRRQPSTVQIGVVAFSEGGFSVHLPSNDPQAILSAIKRLQPERGTSLAHGILASLDTIAASLGEDSQPPAPEAGESGQEPNQEPVQTYEHAVIVLITDGENTAPPDPLEAAQVAAEHRVRIFPVGIGSPEGAILEVEGFSVHTMLDEAMLQQIADISGGAYTNAANEEELSSVYDNVTPHLVIKEEKMEVTSLFTGAGLLLLLVGGVFSLLWFSRLP